MQWLGLMLVCLLGGWWLYSMLAGDGDQAADAARQDPGRALSGVVFFSIIVFVGLTLLGLLGGGCSGS